MKCVGGRTTVRCQVVRTFHCYLCEVKCNGSFFFQFKCCRCCFVSRSVIESTETRNVHAKLRNKKLTSLFHFSCKKECLQSI